VAKILPRLHKRRNSAIEEYYMAREEYAVFLRNKKKMTYAEIGHRLGVNQQRATQLVWRAQYGRGNIYLKSLAAL
jgi:hypothetical protein